MIHWPIHAHSIRHFTKDQNIINNPPKIEEAIDTLLLLKKQGKIRQYGVSNFSRSRFKDLSYEEIAEKTGNRDVSILLADLSSMKEVRRLSGEVIKAIPKLDVLVNNAGGVFMKRQITTDGYEMTFALNHLSPFLLTNLLLELLKKSSPSRIVTVASMGHYMAHIDFNKRFRVGKYGVDVENLERVGVSALRQAAEQCDLVIVDEIGKMELFSADFREAVLDIINRRKEYWARLCFTLTLGLMLSSISLRLNW
jgi:hypothetical protein